MRVKVTLLQHRGRALKRKELLETPPHIGALRIKEARDYDLSRPVVRARLLDIHAGTEADVLPELSDVRLLWADGNEMRLSGFEEIEGAAYAQTWALELC